MGDRLVTKALTTVVQALVGLLANIIFVALSRILLRSLPYNCRVILILLLLLSRLVLTVLWICRVSILKALTVARTELLERLSDPT